MDAKNVLFMVCLVIGCIGLLFVLVGGTMTYVRAKRAGILKFRVPSRTLLLSYLLVVLLNGCISMIFASDAAKARQVLADAQMMGSQAFLQAENDTATVVLDEERYVEQKAGQYQRKADENQGKAYGYLGAALCYGCTLLLWMGFVTKEGWLGMTERKPRRLIPAEKDHELQFFIGKTKDKPLLRVPDTPENREKYAALLDRDEKDEKEN